MLVLKITNRRSSCLYPVYGCVYPTLKLLQYAL